MSSVSSSGGPEYNEFYDKDAVSEGHSVDSFVIRNIHEKRDKARKKGGKDEEEFKNPFKALFATFGKCCVSSDGVNNYENNTKNKNKHRSSQKSSAKLPIIGDFSIPDIKKLAEINPLHKKDSVLDSSSSSSASPGRKNHKKKKSNRSNNEEITNKNIKWRIRFLHCTPPVLSYQQKCWSALVWCLKIENSQKMSERMMVEIFSGAMKEKEKVNITHLLKNKDDFSVLELVRLVDSRTVQDILGDIAGVLESLPASGCLYVIIEKLRVVSLYARKQGELLDMAVFDIPSSFGKRRLPSYYGFRNFEAMNNFIVELYEKDPDVKKETNRIFHTWIMRSKLTYNEVPQTTNYTVAPKAKNDFLNDEKLKLKDPKHEAKVMYTSMYRATAKPIAEENIFSIDPVTGMNAENQNSIDKATGFMGKQEFDDEFDAKPNKREIH